MRQGSARHLPENLHLRDCWQRGASAMQHWGSAQRPLPEGMTGVSLRCTVATALLGTLIPPRGRRQQGGSQLRLASLAFLFFNYSCRPAYGISLPHGAKTAPFTAAARTLLTACCPAAGEGSGQETDVRVRERDCVFNDGPEAWSPV